MGLTLVSLSKNMMSSTNELPPSISPTIPPPDGPPGLSTSNCTGLDLPITPTTRATAPSYADITAQTSTETPPQPSGFSDNSAVRPPSRNHFPYTLEPYEPPTPQQLKRLSRSHRLAVLSSQRPLPVYKPDPFTSFFEIQFSPSTNIRTDINIIKTQTELRALVGPLPSRPLQTSNPAEFTKNSYLIKVGSKAQSDKLQTLTELDGHRVTVTASSLFNTSQGLIVSEALTHSSPAEILRDLGTQGVTKVERLSARNREGTLAPSNRFILHFTSATPPQIITIGQVHRELVEPYIPHPRRCFRCQLLGHLSSHCRSPTEICACCGLSGHADADCSHQLQCVNCGGSHRASSSSCPHYLLRRDILTLRTIHGLTTREAEDFVHAQYLSKGKQFIFKTHTASRRAANANEQPLPSSAPPETPTTFPSSTDDPRAIQTPSVPQKLSTHTAKPSLSSSNQPREKRELARPEAKPPDKSTHTPSDDLDVDDLSPVHGSASSSLDTAVSESSTHNAGVESEVTRGTNRTTRRGMGLEASSSHHLPPLPKPPVSKSMPKQSQKQTRSSSSSSCRTRSGGTLSEMPIKRGREHYGSIAGDLDKRHKPDSNSKPPNLNPIRVIGTK